MIDVYLCMPTRVQDAHILVGSRMALCRRQRLFLLSTSPTVLFQPFAVFVFSHFLLAPLFVICHTAITSFCDELKSLKPINLYSICMRSGRFASVDVWQKPNAVIFSFLIPWPRSHPGNILGMTLPEMTVQITPFGSRKHNVRRLPWFVVAFAFFIVLLLSRLFLANKKTCSVHNWTMGTRQVLNDPKGYQLSLVFRASKTCSSASS